jgi:hypothetical protein
MQCVAHQEVIAPLSRWQERFHFQMESLRPEILDDLDLIPQKKFDHDVVSSEEYRRPFELLSEKSKTEVELVDDIAGELDILE